MIQNQNSSTQDRSARFQRLLAERRSAYPKESYDQSFSAVIHSALGAELFANMERSQSTIATDTVPVQSPRHAALLGRLWPIPDAEFKRLWIEKFGTTSGAALAKSYGQDWSAGEPITGDEAKKRTGYEKFLQEVQNHEAKGFSYDESWRIAATTEPGKTAYQEWVGLSKRSTAIRESQ